MNNKKRTETFVFEFDDQETFKEFFDEYFNVLPVYGMKCLGASNKNLIKENDDLFEIIGNLYDIAVKNYMPRDIEKKTLEEVEKLLGIK